MSLISIIVPVYNAEKVLHYCVDSLLSQTYRDFEIILVDDGSTDCSGTVCDNYADKDPRIRVIHQQNGGVSNARNNGIIEAKGEYICFVDSDDYVSSNYLSALIEVKDRYPNIDNIWCGMQTTNGYDKDNALRRVVFSNNESISFSSRKNIMDLHEKWLNACPFCKLFSREVIISNNLSFDERLSLGEDLLFNFDYLDCTRDEIVVHNNALYYYVQSDSHSLTKGFQKDLFEKNKIVNKAMFDYMIKWGCDNNHFIKYYNNCFFIYEYICASK